MFNVAAEQTFKRTVPVQTPVDGGHRDDSVIAFYRVIPTDKVKQFDLNTEEGLRDFLKAAVVKLDDLVGADKQPVPFSDDLFEQLLGLPYLRLALMRTYFDAVAKVKAGN